MQVYGSRKMLALLAMGFASGLPLFLASKTLQSWLTTEKVDLGLIGAFSLVNLPYSLKFLWAPLLDRFSLPFLGRRQGWLLVFQALLLGGILLLSFQDPSSLAVTPGGSTECITGEWLCALQQKFLLLYHSPFFWITLFIAVCSASQDVSVDAYRTEVLTEAEMGAGAATFVLGYRVALLVTGGWAFILADRIPWPEVYRWIAPLMGIGLLATLWSPPGKTARAPATLSQAIVEPLRDFVQRPRWFVILIFVVLYKLGDAVVNNMSTPFLLQLGFSQTQLGAIQGGLGLVSTIVGALVGGGILSKIGIHRSLWIFGGLQALSNMSYLALSTIGANLPLLFVAINVENFCAGLGTAAFTAFLMQLCNPQFTATQYALLSSLFAVSRDILIAPAGEIAKNVGWVAFFGLSIGIALPGLMLLPYFAPWQSPPEAP